MGLHDILSQLLGLPLLQHEIIVFEKGRNEQAGINILQGQAYGRYFAIKEIEQEMLIKDANFGIDLQILPLNWEVIA